MTDLSSPVADVDAILSHHAETVRMKVIAWILARDVSPFCMPKDVLTQLGENCPGETENAADGEHAQSVRHRSGDNGTSWKDTRPCTPRGDRKAVFERNNSVGGKAETDVHGAA